MTTPHKVKVLAPAKVNIALKVGGVNPDGYHPVETVYHAVDLYDDVIATRTEGISLSIDGEGAEAAGIGPENLAWRAAVLLAEYAGIEPNVHLHINKRIPVAGGMAGGSADAAGALVACDALWQLNTAREKLLSLAAKLGSDIPFSIAGGNAIGRGRGDELTTLLTRGEFHWVFALSDQGLSTPAVYKKFDELTPNPKDPEVEPDLLQALSFGEIEKAATLMSNDLQAPAIALRQSLGRVLQAGREAGALAALVSGSGPTCAFVAKNADHALTIAVELQASGLIQRTVRASGPVRGAHVVSVD